MNLYKRGLHPFTPEPMRDAHSKEMWQSLLDESEELGTIALTLLKCAVSEAAVERTFSHQKFVDGPLRTQLHMATMQAQLFVRFLNTN